MQDSLGTSDPCLVSSREVRNSVLLTLVPASGHLSIPVLMREMLVLTVSLSSAYQAAVDLFCLSVSTSPLVQDFSISPPIK